MFSIDSAITEFDKALRVVAGISSATRVNPANALPEETLSLSQKRHSAGLMRVNQVGEVCAQALYQSQSHRASDPNIARQFDLAAQDEQDHLSWTTARLRELDSRPSLLNPVWYAASYGLGTLAGRLGDATSLGFVVETERQVEAHLASHLERLPREDLKSRAIVEQMRQDEAAHGQHAQALGAATLPAPLKRAMRAFAKGMTTVAYYI
ncbi:MAG: 2-polyprenyl-3-methyl-6-methoxy-1,4-benzoquinone monooxygenase [Herminiimonas sp.]|nr:2-polyprenyl-3-methyl-6-methoxy-1,4-benzoquinone monooxygenase [Herminiimonas sp.]